MNKVSNSWLRIISTTSANIVPSAGWNIKNTIWGLVAIPAFLVLDCNNNGRQPAVDKVDSISGSRQSIESNADNPVSAEPAVSAEAVVIKDDLLNAVYHKYEELTTALIKEEIAKAKIAAGAMEAGAKETGNSRLMVQFCRQIMDARNIEEQRSAYAGLSNALISRIKSAGLSAGSLYIEYCPMALNDKGGFWLSSRAEIKNPYFGDKMLSCGEIKETLKFP
jgi:hypothetical protein